MEDCSKYESSKRITPPTQTFIEEFNTVVFEKDELEYRYMFTLIAQLPPLAKQNSNSDVENRVHTV